MDSRVENILNGILNDNFDFNNDQSRIEYLLIELGNKLKNMETGGISDEELKNAINECLKNSLDSYSTTEEMNSAISEATTDMATNTNVDNKLSEYSTNESLNNVTNIFYQNLIKKVDKVTGKGLSTEDYTTEEKEKVSGMDTRFSNVQNNIDTESARAKAAEQGISDKISNLNNTSDIDKPVSTSQQTAIDLAYRNSNAYTDQKISELINGAPETMDTLKEVADEIAKNKDVETALNESIGKKANQTELDTHTENDSIHVTTIEKDKWNDANDKKHSHSNKSVLDGITSALIIAWNNAVEHITDTVKHITSSERTNWNAAKTHADSAHAPSNAQANVIETIKVNGTALTPSSKAVDITIPTNTSNVVYSEVFDLPNDENSITFSVNPENIKNGDTTEPLFYKVVFQFFSVMDSAIGYIGHISVSPDIENFEIEKMASDTSLVKSLKKTVSSSSITVTAVVSPAVFNKVKIIIIREY